MNNIPIHGPGLFPASQHYAPREQMAVEAPDSRVSHLVTRYIAVARRRAVVIAGVAIAVLLAGLVVTMLMTPKFTATAQLEIQRENFNIVKVQGVEPESSPLDLEFYQTQYGLLQARSLAERVAGNLRLGDDAAFFAMFKDSKAAKWFDGNRVVPGKSTREERRKRAADQLLKHIAVDPIRLSRLVNVSFTAPDAAFAAEVANAWTVNFIQSNLERRFDATAYARKFLEDRLAQLRGRLDESERKLVGYAARENIINLPAQTAGPAQPATAERSIIADDLASLNQELARATADRVRAESRLRSSGGTVEEALRNDAISGLRQRRAELAADYAKLLTQFEPAYPPVVALSNQIKQLDSAISREEGRVQSSLATTYRASVQREAELKDRVSQLKGNLLAYRCRSIQYDIYQRDVDTNRQLYDGLLQRYKEIGIAGGVGANNIAIVDKARVPEKKSSPRLLVNMLTALIFGLAMGGGIALILEQIDDVIGDPTELKRALPLPLIGVVPRTADEDPVAALSDRKSPLSEAYLSIQTTLAFATTHGLPRSFAVTSSRPSEGKTTTSVALAKSLARTNRKVLLVDGDLRSPSIHGLFGVRNDHGLSNYLAGDDNFDHLIVPDQSSGMSVMPAGPQPPNAAELLTSDRLSHLLLKLKERFDVVVIDAPPVLGLADAPLLGGMAEGVIFVVESSKTRASLARVSVERLVAANVHLLGTILTKFDAKAAHYGYGYDYGYSYGQQGGESASAA